MICMLRRQEPSFSSIKEKSFESRRVRIQPWTRTKRAGAEASRRSLIEVGESVSFSVMRR